MVRYKKAKLILRYRPQSFHRIQFRAVRRQVQQRDVLGHLYEPARDSRSEPVHISEILPEVMTDIERRRERAAEGAETNG